MSFEESDSSDEGPLEHPDAALIAEHERYLLAHAVDVELAVALGVRSIRTLDELPEDFADLGEAAVPAILFPWTDPHARDEPQIKIMDGSKGYRFRSKERGYQAPFWAVREVGKPAGVLIVEGSKQVLAVAAVAPADWSVYGISGCMGWRCDGRATPHLEVVDGLDVVLLFDADRLTNRNVWDAAVALEDELRVEGAATMKYLDVPAGGKTGIDDYLAGKPADRRERMFERLLERAKSLVKSDRPKAAPRSPRAVKGQQGVAIENLDLGSAPELSNDPNRPYLNVDEDRLLVMNTISERLCTLWDRTRLFSYGRVLTQLKPDGTLDPLVKDTFADLIQESLTTVASSQHGEMFYTWPDATTMGTCLSRHDRYSTLTKLSRVPFVRLDGTVCQTPGYDAETTTFLFLTQEMEDLDIPAEPSGEEVREAVVLLLDDWLGDMPFHTAADRANGLALALTPLIRGLVPLVPLAVVDGLQMGVGKNLLADVMSILVTGEVAAPLPYTRDEEETRKVITATFRQGPAMFIFDEAHVIEGAQLARAITSGTYRDRILGGSQIADFPNQVTWISLGNNVTVNGDLLRRVYRIALHPVVDNPHDRPASVFRHPDLKGWTRANRVRLLRACLVLIRAWFTNGQPRFERSTALGSFEQWEKLCAGILGNAGVPEFLGNLQEWRSDADTTTGFWLAHLEFLHATFGEGATFTTLEVKKALGDLGPRAIESAPPSLTDPSEPDYSRKLGYAYRSIAGQRRFHGYVLFRAEETQHGKRGTWRITGPMASPTEGTEDMEDIAVPTRTRTAAPSDVMGVPRMGSAGADLASISSISSISSTHPVIVSVLRRVSVTVPACSRCGTEKATVPPANLLYVCPSCHPGSFHRD